MFSGINVKMKIVGIIAILIIPILVGYAIRFSLKKKPKTEFLIWVVLMAAMFIVFIYSLILVINQDTPLFTKNNMGNELFVISSTMFLLLGFFNFMFNRNHFWGKHDKNERK